MTAPLAILADVAFCPCGAITSTPVTNEWGDTFCTTTCRTVRDDELRHLAAAAVPPKKRRRR